jgi:hypothetical protein
MKVEEIRSLQINLESHQIRVGKALTVIEVFKDGRPCGRDLVFRTSELPELIEAFTKAKEFTDSFTPTKI